MKWHVFLILFVLAVPLIVPHDSPPWLGEELRYTGTYVDSVHNSRIEFNLTVTITDYAYSPSTGTISFNLTYSFEGDYNESGSYSDNPPSYRPIYVPFLYYDVPIVVAPDVMRSFFNHRFQETLLGDTIADAYVDSALILNVTSGGIVETYSIDPSSGLILEYHNHASGYTLDVYLVSPSVNPTLNGEPVNDRYHARTLVIGDTIESLAVRMVAEYDHFSLFEYVLYTPEGLHNGSYVAFDGGMYRIPYVMINHEAFEEQAYELHEVKLNLLGNRLEVKVGYIFYMPRSLYAAYLDEGRVVSLSYGSVNVYGSGEFENIPPLVAGGLNGSELTISSIDEAASVTIEGPNVTENLTVGSGLELNVSLARVVVSDANGSVVFAIHSVSTRPEIAAERSGDELILRLRDDSSFLKLTVYSSGNEEFNGYVPAYYELSIEAKYPARVVVSDGENQTTFEESPQGLSINVTYDINGNNVTLHVTISGAYDEYALALYVDGSLIVNETVGVEFDYTLTLEPGEHNVTIVVTDPAGNVARRSETIEIASNTSGGTEGETTSTNPVGLRTVAVLAILLAIVAALVVRLRRK